MNRVSALAAALTIFVGTSATGHEPDAAVQTAPPEAPYQQVSALVALPDFIPGLGQLFVDPSTLPAGPFLAYDHEGRLVSSIFMIPLAALNPDMSFDDLAVPGRSVDHVDISYNAGHPGVEEPHAHIVLWHVPAGDEASVAQ